VKKRARKKKGLRVEVHVYKARHYLKSVAEAAKRLGISYSGLKSLMSDTTADKASAETRKRIVDDLEN
jgi:hypothetical protein